MMVEDCAVRAVAAESNATALASAGEQVDAPEATWVRFSRAKRTDARSRQLGRG